MPLMHRAHRVREYRRITHPGIEDTQGRGTWLNMRQFLRHPFGNPPFLIRRIDESEVFQSVIEKSEGLVGHKPDVLASWPLRQSSSAHSHGDVTARNSEQSVKRGRVTFREEPLCGRKVHKRTCS